jgi:hypothetical protein
MQQVMRRRPPLLPKSLLFSAVSAVGLQHAPSAKRAVIAASVQPGAAACVTMHSSCTKQDARTTKNIGTAAQHAFILVQAMQQLDLITAAPRDCCLQFEHKLFCMQAVPRPKRPHLCMSCLAQVTHSIDRHPHFQVAHTRTTRVRCQCSQSLVNRWQGIYCLQAPCRQPRCTRCLTTILHLVAGLWTAGHPLRKGAGLAVQGRKQA